MRVEKNALLALCNIIATFGRVEVPMDLQKAYQGAKGFLHTRPQARELCDVWGTIRNVRRSEKEAWVEINIDTIEWEVVTVRFWNNQNADTEGVDFTEMADLALPFMSIFVSELQISTHNDLSFSSTAQSIVVLEPDYLIEAADLAACCQGNTGNDMLFLAGRLDQSSTNDAMMIGIAAGAVLEGALDWSDEHYVKVYTRDLFGSD